MGVASCQTLEDAPAYPTPTYKQPIIEQLFCQPANCNKTGAQPCVCETKSLCREWELKDNEWALKQNHALKFCHGIIGINSTEWTEVQNYKREMQTYIQKLLKRCGRKCL